jgi:hypothetical protein
LSTHLRLGLPIRWGLLSLFNDRNNGSAQQWSLPCRLSTNSTARFVGYLKQPTFPLT